MSERVSVSSGRLDVGEGIVWKGRVTLVACTINTDKTNDATITFYDGTSSSGVDSWSFRVPGTQDASGRNFANLLLEKGLYYKLEGTGSYCYFEKLN